MQVAPWLEIGEHRDDRLLDLVCELYKRAAEALRNFFKHRGAGVFSGVDGMAEAHDPLAVHHFGRDYRTGAIEGPYLVKQVQCSAGRAAVQWAAERSDRADDARSHVSAGGGDDPGGEGRGVETMVDRRDQVVL